MRMSVMRRMQSCASCFAVTVITLEVMMASTRVSSDERPNNTTLRA